MPILNVNGREVHVQELNPEGKETLVLVHGMFSNLSVYYFHIAPVLATTFRVVMYDLKSHGLSGRIAEGYDLNSMSEDLEGLVDILGLDTFHLAGYSFGGLIALNTALRLEARIRKLVVIEAPDPADEKARGIIDEYSREFLENYVKNYT
ncbi:MAG: alpha/beta fold hydrolase, partial [Siphonobacter aquaeclarae]|nr:alpha/beta fold hydrolase [Siphonobacter aquaeclarae]